MRYRSIVLFTQKPFQLRKRESGEIYVFLPELDLTGLEIKDPYNPRLDLLLGDLPLIGFVFSSKAEESMFSEIIVFVTPHIVEQLGLTEDEKKAYEETEFDGPCPVTSEIEKEGDCLWK